MQVEGALTGDKIRSAQGVAKEKKGVVEGVVERIGRRLKRVAQKNPGARKRSRLIGDAASPRCGQPRAARLEMEAVMTDAGSHSPEPSEAHRRLNKFVGVWTSSGESYAAGQRADDPRASAVPWTSDETWLVTSYLWDAVLADLYRRAGRNEAFQRTATARFPERPATPCASCCVAECQPEAERITT